MMMRLRDKLNIVVIIVFIAVCFIVAPHGEQTSTRVLVGVLWLLSNGLNIYCAICTQREIEECLKGR
jgi:hypothetical protein